MTSVVAAAFCMTYVMVADPTPFTGEVSSTSVNLMRKTWSDASKVSSVSEIRFCVCIDMGTTFVPDTYMRTEGTLGMIQTGDCKNLGDHRT